MINKIDNKKMMIIIAVAIFAVALIIIIFCNAKENSESQDLEQFDLEAVTETQEEKSEVKKIIIHITGCVRNTGIVEVDDGSRIIDVIEKAGGLTEEADISKVNLAYIVEDAQKIYIPSILDEKEIEYVSTENGDNVIIEDKTKEKTGKVNINKTKQTELEQIPGIGPSTALKIINYRNEKGEFNSIEEIKEISGIGDKKFNEIKEHIEV